MLSAPAAMPATTEVILPAGFTPVDGIGGSRICTASATRSCRPVSSASRITGTRPAHDTRFSSSNWIAARRHGCDNLTGSASLTGRRWILRKPIIAGQEALSCQPLRRRERSFGGLRLSKRVYIAIDNDADKARDRITDALERRYGYFGMTNLAAVPVAGTVDDCVAGLHEVAAVGAQVILLN